MKIGAPTWHHCQCGNHARFPIAAVYPAWHICDSAPEISMFAPKPEKVVAEHIAARVKDPDFDATVASFNHGFHWVKLIGAVLPVALSWMYYYRSPEVGVVLPLFCTTMAFSLIGYIIETRDRAWYAAVCIKLLREERTKK